MAFVLQGPYCRSWLAVVLTCLPRSRLFEDRAGPSEDRHHSISASYPTTAAHIPACGFLAHQGSSKGFHFRYGQGGHMVKEGWPDPGERRHWLARPCATNKHDVISHSSWRVPPANRYRSLPLSPLAHPSCPNVQRAQAGWVARREGPRSGFAQRFAS